ncbi:hypothetical protein FKM82_019456 [Ascaphus truei]
MCNKVTTCCLSPRSASESGVALYYVGQTSCKWESCGRLGMGFGGRYSVCVLSRMHMYPSRVTATCV